MFLTANVPLSSLVYKYSQVFRAHEECMFNIDDSKVLTMRSGKQTYYATIG